MTPQFIKLTPFRLPEKFLIEWTAEMVTHLRKEKVQNRELLKREVSLVFVDKSQMRKTNQQFRGKNKATDVLSFESMDPDSLGELIFSPEVIQHQSREHGLSFRGELGYLYLHGVLHLLGYDHETSEEEAKVMFAIQDKIFERLVARVPSPK